MVVGAHGVLLMLAVRHAEVDRRYGEGHVIIQYLPEEAITVLETAPTMFLVIPNFVQVKQTSNLINYKFLL